MLVQAHPARGGRVGVGRGHAVVDEPAEDVADAGLTGLVAEQAGGDAAVDDAAHARNLGECVAVHDMAGRGAHDRDHLAGLDRLCGGGGDMRVDIADRDGDALGQAGPLGRLLRQRAGLRAELADRMLELVGDEAGEAGVECGQEVGARVLAVLQDALVPGGAGIAHVRTAQLPDDPVGGLDPLVHLGVDVRCLFEHLQSLGELPLRGDEAAIAVDPRLTALMRERVDAVSLRLRGVVLPELDVGVRAARELRQLVQRSAVGLDRDHRAGGEVGADADDVGRVDACRGDGLRDGRLQHVDVVLRHLQRPVRPERRHAIGKEPVHDRVRVLPDGTGELGAVAHPDDDGTAGQRPEVDADHVPLAAHASPRHARCAPIVSVNSKE